ncbi:MAG: TauD/TfdA family dioxygenase [Pseudomonadota bacterium]
MSEILREPLQHRNVWHGDEITSRDDWQFTLRDEQIVQLNSAMHKADGERVSYDDVSADSFELDTLRDTIDAVNDVLEDGSGFALVKGFPVDGHEDALRKVYRGICSNWGSLIVQDTQGTIIDEVYDRGLSYTDIKVRGYTTNAQLTPHCDSGDMLALLCVRPALEGGLNYLSNALAIYNDILEHKPEYIEPLCEGFHYNIRGNGPEGPWRDMTEHRVPVFSYHEGRLSVRFNEKAILTAEQLPGVAPLSELEKSAVKYVAELANDPRFHIPVMLEEGDMLLMCNHVVLHTRTGFTDHEDVAMRRFLFRAWINVPNGRPLTHEFADHYNTGPRQGPDASVALAQKAQAG